MRLSKWVARRIFLKLYLSKNLNNFTEEEWGGKKNVGMIAE